MNRKRTCPTCGVPMKKNRCPVAIRHVAINARRVTWWMGKEKRNENAR